MLLRVKLATTSRQVALKRDVPMVNVTLQKMRREDGDARENLNFHLGNNEVHPEGESATESEGLNKLNKLIRF